MFKAGDTIQSLVGSIPVIIKITYRCTQTNACTGYNIINNDYYSWTILDECWKLYIPKKNHLPKWL